MENLDLDFIQQRLKRDVKDTQLYLSIFSYISHKISEYDSASNSKSLREWMNIKQVAFEETGVTPDLIIDCLVELTSRIYKLRRFVTLLKDLVNNYVPA